MIETDRSESTAAHRARRELLRDGLLRAGGGTIPVYVDRADPGRDARSMQPTFGASDEIAWRASSEAPAFGEIVLFSADHGKSPVAHRIVGAHRRGGFLAMGDGRPTTDEAPVDPENLIGIVCAIRRREVWFSCDSRRARVYATIAAAIGRVADLKFRFASVVDDPLLRLFRASKRIWVVRRLAWWSQRISRWALHGLLFRACHDRIEFNRVKQLIGRNGGR